MQSYPSRYRKGGGAWLCRRDRYEASKQPESLYLLRQDEHGMPQYSVADWISVRVRVRCRSNPSYVYLRYRTLKAMTLDTFSDQVDGFSQIYPSDE